MIWSSFERELFGTEVERGVYEGVMFICASVALKEHCVPGGKRLAGAASSAFVFSLFRGLRLIALVHDVFMLF